LIWSRQRKSQTCNGEIGGDNNRKLFRLSVGERPKHQGRGRGEKDAEGSAPGVGK